MTTCVVEGCESAVHAHGWCSSHYMREHRHGSPLAGLTYQGEPLEYLKQHMHDGCCSPWIYGYVGDGYSGRVTLNGRRKPAYVASYMIGNNLIEIPRGMVIRHLCNKGHLGCFNFECLALGTKAEDAQDRIRAGTWTHGENHKCAVLSSDEVVEIRMLWATGFYRQLDLAEMFHVSQVTISAIVNFKWRRNG